jgi:hypothetical protein
LLHQRIGNIAIKLTAEHSSLAWMNIVIATETGMLVLALALSIIEAHIRKGFTNKLKKRTVLQRLALGTVNHR